MQGVGWATGWVGVTFDMLLTIRSGKSTQKTTQSQPTAGSDSVQLSQAAQARLATLQEATETPGQTAAEAGHGDLQAQKLLAKETPVK